MKLLWLRPLLPGGFLNTTRRPSRAAAAESIGAFGSFAVIHAAWVGGSYEAGGFRTHPYRIYTTSLCGARRLGAPPGMVSTPVGRGLAPAARYGISPPQGQVSLPAHNLALCPRGARRPGAPPLTLPLTDPDLGP